MLASSGSPPVIVGHRGAPALAPENSPAGFRAAIAAGAGAVEVDVRRGPGRELVLAHRRRAARRGRPVRLEEALDLLAEAAYREVGLLLDVKEAGTEAEAAAAVRAAGFLGRTVACGREVAVLRALAEAEPALPRAWSLKRARHAAAAGLGSARRDVPGAVAEALRLRLCGAVSVHRSLATPPLFEVARRGGGEVYVWGIDRPSEARRLAALGADAIVVDDPRPYRDLAGSGPACSR